MSYKLLLVDDEKIIRDGIMAMIDWDKLQIQVTASCGDAFSALQSITNNMPDILLTDIRMPGLDGLELTEQAMQLCPRLQVIILSGFNEFDYARKAMKYGVKEYLLKPCSSEEMEEALARCCMNVERDKTHVLQLAGERVMRVRQLVSDLNEILHDAIDEKDLHRQVMEITGRVEDPSLFQDVLLHILTANALPEEGFQVLKQATREPDQILPIMCQCLSKLRESKDTNKGFVQQMVSYVQAHYDNDSLSLQYLADHVVFMNADYIGRQFTRVVGQKFSAYLLQIRMEHAMTMIRSREQLLSYEIAQRVGLGKNPHYFSQVFRKYTGKTVTEYKEMTKMSDI